MAAFRQSLPADLLSSLRAATGRRERVLGWARTEDGALVGLTDRFLRQDADGHWATTHWHAIDSGRWDDATRTLTVVTPEATHTLHLVEPNRFPDLFNERVSASIIANRRVDLGAGRHVVLVLRRDLGGGATAWRVLAGPGVDTSAPAVRDRVEAELAAAAAEYDID
ncbi:MAG TPA: hypothetical protein PLE12_01455 [Propionicimonas sp.]|jgi:hypothetical protein|nr:hypothetical protein [Propionicimonas sp.]